MPFSANSVYLRYEEAPPRSPPDAKALERAISQGITARRTSRRCWMVSASSGQGEYEVVVDGALIACRCAAGLHGRARKHAALVRVLDASGAAPVPEPRPAPAGSSYAALFGGED